MYKLLPIALGLIVIGAGTALAKPRKVYKVSEVTAKVVGNTMTIEATGSVRTGGWTHPILVRVSKSSGVLTMDFLAAPPDGMVTQVITPIHVSEKRVPPPFPTKVKVVAETNSMTVSVEFVK